MSEIDELIFKARVAYKIQQNAIASGKVLDIVPAARTYNELFQQVMDRAKISRTKAFAVIVENKVLR